MKLSQNDFKRLTDRYIDKQYPVNILEMSEAYNQAIFQEVIEFLENEFGERLNLAAISSGSGDYQTEWENVCTILQSCLTYNEADKKLSFNLIAAIAASEEIHQQAQTVDIRALHGEVSNLGIREKYLNHELRSREWLTDLDIQRMLNDTGMREKIFITRFNATDIGMKLHFEREKNKEALEPYSIPFVFNKGSESGRSGTHWFAGIITVNPIDHSIIYEVEDSFELSKKQRGQIRSVMRKAISFKEESIVNGINKAYEAFPEWVINPQGRRVIGKESQKDSYSCGYRALHKLYNAEVLRPLVDQDEDAKAFAACADDSRSLVRHVYKVQLEKLSIPVEEFEKMSLKSEDNLETVEGARKLDPEYIEVYLDLLEEEDASTPNSIEESETTIVQEEKEKSEEQALTNEVKIYDEYNRSHDGKVVFYSKRYVKLLATLRGDRKLFADFRAARNGEGEVFPYFNAFIRGEINFKQFLFSYSPSKAQEKQKFKGSFSGIDESLSAQPLKTPAKRSKTATKKTIVPKKADKALGLSKRKKSVDHEAPPIQQKSRRHKTD